MSVKKRWMICQSIRVKQLAIDFCTDEKSILSKENIFTEYKRLEGRRIFQEGECFLKVASVNGKILASGKKDIIDWVRDKYKDGNGAWFMDMECLHELEAGLSKFGCHIGQAHPFYIATEKTEVDTKGYEIKKYVGEELEQFRGDDRFGEAFIFDDMPKDEIGIGAYKDGKIIGKTCQNEMCYINDKRKEYEMVVNKYMGKLVRIEYDIIISGFFFLNTDNIIYNIKPID